MSFSIKIDEKVLEDLKKIPDKYKTRFLRIFGSKYKDKTQENMRARSKGGYFWRRMSGTISVERESTAVEIGSDSPIAAHKELGGVISAPGTGAGSRHSKYLTIPISDISRGKNAGDFKGLFLFKSKKGNLLLARNTKARKITGSTIKKYTDEDGDQKTKVIFHGKKINTLQPLFVLKKSVTQKPEPFFPNDFETRGVFDDSVEVVATVNTNH